MFANYARYYQNLMLILPLTHFSNTPNLRGYYNRAPTANGPGCDPLTQSAPYEQCRHPGNLLPRPGSRPEDISRRYEQLAAINSPVDPQLQPQSSDEFVLGGEHEVLESTLLGLSYTRRTLNSAVEDMSRNELASFFIVAVNKPSAREAWPKVRDTLEGEEPTPGIGKHRHRPPRQRFAQGHGLRLLAPPDGRGRAAAGAL